MMSRDIFGPLFVASLDAKTLYKSVFFARHVRSGVVQKSADTFETLKNNGPLNDSEWIKQLG